MSGWDRFKDPKSIKWSRAIKDRDGFRCIVCKKYGVPLHSHHLNSFDLFIEQRYDLDNGVCLCQVHHDLFHSLYGKGRNTKYQFEEFKKSIALFKKIIQKLNKVLPVESETIDVVKEDDE